MKAMRNLPVPVVVASGFFVFVGCISLLVFVLGEFPSREQSCHTECQAKSKAGRLVGKYPAHMAPPGKNPLIVSVIEMQCRLHSAMPNPSFKRDRREAAAP
jgi:hypothetical protein